MPWTSDPFDGPEDDDYGNTEPDDLDLESMYRCIDCDSRHHRRCDIDNEPNTEPDKDTQ